MENTDLIKFPNDGGPFVAALIKLQKSIKAIPKNCTAGSGKFSYKYADFASIISGIREAMLDHGLYFAQSCFQSDDLLTVKTVIYHESGSFAEFYSSGPVIRDGKNAMQARGKGETYLKRYALASALGLSVTDDPDGEYERQGHEDSRGGAGRCQDQRGPNRSHGRDRGTRRGFGADERSQKTDPITASLNRLDPEVISLDHFKVLDDVLSTPGLVLDAPLKLKARSIYEECLRYSMSHQSALGLMAEEPGDDSQKRAMFIEVYKSLSGRAESVNGKFDIFAHLDSLQAS